jgi:excisionase family DNA binding protein
MTYLSVNEAAKELNVEPCVIYSLIKRRKLTAVRVGRTLRVNERAWIAYLNAQTTGPLDGDQDGLEAEHDTLLFKDHEF